MAIEKRKILIVSKYELYFIAIQSQVWSKEFEFIFLKNIYELENNLRIYSKPEAIFFPHVSEYIPEKIFSNFTCVGFHTGDLPRDRGGTPIQNKISRKEYITRVNAIQVTRSIDAGAIYATRQINLSKGNIYEMLAEVSKLIAEMIFEILSLNPEPIPQNELEATYFERRNIDNYLDLNKLTSKEIYDHIRMVDGLDYPKAKMIINDKVFELSEATYENRNLEFKCKLIEGDNE